MDMLGKPWMREAILDHYQVSIYKSMTAYKMLYFHRHQLNLI